MGGERKPLWQVPLVTGEAAGGLRVFCHGLHMALVFYGLFGWVVPSAPWLIAHLVFIPALVVVWIANAGVCPLNNIETLLTTGRWRNPENGEEGSFLVTIVERYLGMRPTQGLMDRVTYGLMAFVWALSWLHLALLPK
jgi:hypothetical protein